MDKNKFYIKEPGFTIPKNYFDKLESQIMDKVALTSQVSNKNAFKVPEKYFEEFESRVIKKTVVGNREPKVISLFRNTTFKYVASVAAVVLIIVSVFQFQQLENQNEDSITQISNYIESGHLDLSTIDFEILLTEEMTEDFSFYSTLDQEAIYDYLSEDIDESQFMND